MSFPIPYLKGVSTSPSLDFLNTHSSSHKSYNTMISNITPIEWTPSKGLLLLKILEECKGNFLIPQVWITWPDLDQDFVSNLEKLLLSLKAYYDSENPVIPQNVLLPILCSKDAAKTLKNIRTKSVMTTWRTTFVEDPDWWNDTLSYHIYDIGDIFYYKYCFFWQEDCDDFKRQLDPLHVKKSYKEKFRQALIDVLDELDFDFDFEPNEILFQPRSSKIVDSKLESVNDYEVRFNKMPCFRSGPRKPGKRSIVPVHPGGVRDTIINQLPDLNTVMAIDKIVGRCLKNHPNVPINNTERFMKKLDDFHSDFQFFYCRDIEKEGITKPRYLLKIMLEELAKRCEYISKVCTSDFFDGDWCQFEDGEIIKSLRGHGLGMANSLTTLMQIVIYRLTVIKYAKNHNTDEKTFGFYAMNDDCVFGINLDSDEAFEFSQLDHEVLENLGLIRKKTKSFLAEKAFVFLELYFPIYFNKKESITRRCQLLPYSAVNITHAKDLMSLMTENPYLDRILSKWGYEFYPEEVNQPRHFGGWFSKSFYGVDISLDIEIEEFTSKQSRAAQAVLFCDMKFKKKLIQTSDPLNLLMFKDIDEYIFNKLPIIGSSMFSHFERLRIRSDFNTLYDRLYKKRQEFFMKSPYLDFKTYLGILIENSDKDIFMMSDIQKWIPDIDITIAENGFTDPYSYNFPICSALRKLKDITDITRPCSYWPLTNSSSSFNCSVLRSEIAEMNLDYYAFEYTDEDVVLPIDELEFKEFIKSWKNPIAVGKYMQIRFNKLGIPKSKPDIIKYKTSFFERELNKLEYIVLSGKRYNFIQNYLRGDLGIDEYFDLLEKEDTLTEEKPQLVELYYPANEREPYFNLEEERTILSDLADLYRIDRRGIVDLLPEGWDLSSFDLEENIIYVMDNQELFHEDVLQFIDLRYDKAIRTVNEFLRFMSFADPSSLGAQFEEMKQNIVSRSRYMRIYLEQKILDKNTKNSSDSEPEFAGDFDVF